MTYEQIKLSITRRTAEFSEKIKGIAYERKGILNSEMLFLFACIPETFSGQILESGRARGQSTLVLSKLFPRNKVISFELHDGTDDADVARTRLAGSKNVELRFGNAEKDLEHILKDGDIVIIDGPKMFRAIRFMLRLLATRKPLVIFIHDVGIETPERRFFQRFMPEALYSDYRPNAALSVHLDTEAQDFIPASHRMNGFKGDTGYGFTLAYIPRALGRNYIALILMSYVYDSYFRIRSHLRGKITP